MTMPRKISPLDTRDIEVFFRVEIEGDKAYLMVKAALSQNLLFVWDMQLEQLGTISAIVANRLHEHRARHDPA